MTAPELADAHWRKSSHSGSNSDCVEVAFLSGGAGLVAARDSKDPTGPALVFTPAEWTTFLTTTRAGLADL